MNVELAAGPNPIYCTQIEIPTDCDSGRGRDSIETKPNAIFLHSARSAFSQTPFVSQWAFSSEWLFPKTYFVDRGPLGSGGGKGQLQYCEAE